MIHLQNGKRVMHLRQLQCMSNVVANDDLRRNTCRAKSSKLTDGGDGTMHKYDLNAVILSTSVLS